MPWNPLSWFKRPAQTALQNANTNVLKLALRNYIKAVNNYEKNNLTTSDVRNVLSRVIGNNNKRTIKNRLANGVARAIAASRHAIPTALEVATSVSAAPKGTITEATAAKNVNNATKNVNRAYIMNTILKNVTKLNTPNKQTAAVQAMINYNPKINFKSLILPPNSEIVRKLLTNANIAANVKYGANRKIKNSLYSPPSTERNAVNIPSGFFNENAAAAAKKAENNAAAAAKKAANAAAAAAAISKLPGPVTVNAAKRAANNAIIANAIARANAITNTTPQVNINAVIPLLQNALKLAPNKTVKSNIGRRLSNLQRRALLKAPPNAEMTRKIGNYIWNERAWGGYLGSSVNRNYPKIAREIKANPQYNLTKINKAALNAYLATKTGHNQAHRNRAMAISAALFAPGN